MFKTASRGFQILLSAPCYTAGWRPVNSNIDKLLATSIKDRGNIVRITQEEVDQLERVALVDFANKEGVERLQAAIEFADQISVVDTSCVAPMVSVLRDGSIYLREDQVDDGNCRESVMANASVTEEEYFVAPPGNIPVTPRKPIIEENIDGAE